MPRWKLLPPGSSSACALVACGAVLGAGLGAPAAVWWWRRPEGALEGAAARAAPPPMTEEDWLRLRAWEAAQPAEPTELLVMWTGVFGQPGLRSEMGPHEAKPCPRRCLLENRRSMLPHAKAVVFHARNLRLDDLPPRDVNGRQPWALFTMEAPVNDGWPYYHPEYTRLFDYSMTYRLDADFPVTYAPAELAATATAPLRTPIAAKEASAPVVFVQSNCGTANNREDYVAELMLHVPVHSYGRCLHNRRWPTNQELGLAGPAGADAPTADVVGRYRFAIVVDNSDCDDYWSEKYFWALQAAVVPIVNGPRAKYRPLLPVPDAALFIDEHTPAELGARLRALAANDTAYAHLLRYRAGAVAGAARPEPLAAEFAVFANVTAHRLEPFCALCVQVHADAQAEREYEAGRDRRAVAVDAARRPGEPHPFSPIRGAVVRPDTSCSLHRFRLPHRHRPQELGLGPTVALYGLSALALAVLAVLAMLYLRRPKGRRPPAPAAAAAAAAATSAVAV